MQPVGLLPSQQGAPSLRVQAPSAVRGWSVGQVLSATVLKAGGEGSASLLRVDGDPVQAHSRLPLHAGQTLRLQVAQAGPPAVLRVLEPGAADDVPAQAARVLRSVLPLQRPLAESLASLQRMADQPHARRASDLPDAARALLSDLLSSIPRPRDAGDGARLAAMVRASGLFYEANLAREAAPRPTTPGSAANTPRTQDGADFKARLASVAEAVHQAAPGADDEGPVKQVEQALRGAIARIEMNQALSVRGSQEQGAVWRMDLPFADERGAQDVGLRIRREHRKDARNGHGEDEWVVELDVHPPGGAPLHARVSLSDGAVHTLFTTEDPQTLSRLQEHGGELERRLEGEALQVGGVRARLAPPPAQEPLTGLLGLVDEHA